MGKRHNPERTLEFLERRIPEVIGVIPLKSLFLAMSHELDICGLEPVRGARWTPEGVRQFLRVKGSKWGTPKLALEQVGEVQAPRYETIEQYLVACLVRFADYYEKASPYEIIASELNAMGHLHSRGGEWRRRSVHKMIRKVCPELEALLTGRRKTPEYRNRLLTSIRKRHREGLAQKERLPPLGLTVEQYQRCQNYHRAYLDWVNGFLLETGITRDQYSEIVARVVTEDDQQQRIFPRLMGDDGG